MRSNRNILRNKGKLFCYLIGITCFVFLYASLSFACSQYENGYELGSLAASAALKLMKTSHPKGNIIAITNAGYAELNGQSTESCLDGLSDVTGASRGKNTLIEIQSHYAKILWFAFYHRPSGMCAYMEVGQEANLTSPISKKLYDTFSLVSVEKIQAAHLYKNAVEYNDKFNNKKVFGENAFRIVTIANALDAGAPTYAVRAFELHDHYCPGITSGIIMVNYLKKYFPSSSYFVQAIQPWCKEDAFLTLLNSTPGKSGFAVTYPTAEDMAKWKQGFESVTNIFYRQDEITKKWQGQLIGFSFNKVYAAHTFPDYGTNSIMTKLYMDLWFLEKIDQIGWFVDQGILIPYKEFDLPQGETPKDWARPGVDPMKKLGLIQE